MTNTKQHTKHFSILFAAVLSCTAMFFALAAPANADVYELGDLGAFPTPACPDAKSCQVIDQLTGYQMKVGTKSNPFRVTKSGRLVAFTLVLPEITDKQAKFFNTKFSDGPTARISVLRPKPRRGAKYRYALVGQSAEIKLADYLGSTPTFPLTNTLFVNRNDIIAVTTSTWLPAFSVGLDNNTIWRASRNAKKCDDVSTPAMHQRVGQLKLYSCGYKAARLLYRATIVSSPRKTAKKK